MADIELVIKIPDFIYTEIRNITNTGIIEHNAKTLYNAIYYSTPLPKHHGRLIDADELIRTMEKDVRKVMSFVDLTDFVWLAPTIIEAEGSESE